MKLKNNLYTIIKSEATDSTANYEIRLNPDCVIYKAHFPEQPITPGVCIIEIAHELIEDMKQCPLEIQMVKNVKFLSVISPLQVQELTYQIAEKNDSYKISVVNGDVAYAKISIVCQK